MWLLQEGQPRDDYKELLQLTLLFLGETPPGGVKFYQPGAISEARFMSKALYSLKLVMFASQVKLTAREKKGLKSFCVFVVLMYVRYWFTANRAISAPQNDLVFLQKLLLYQKVDQKVSEVAVKKFSGHLWYLNEELAGLGLLDDNVPLEIKRRMATKIQTQVPSSTERAGRRVELKPTDFTALPKKDLSDFVSAGTVKLFERFDLDYGFLCHDPVTWPSRDDFKAASTFFSRLNVTNDVAERGVSLTQEYLGNLKSESNFQNLLIVAQASRRKQQPCTKAALASFDI